MTNDAPDTTPRRTGEALDFYLTAPAPCPYLTGLEEQRVLTILETPAQAAALPSLLQNGFRRSQQILYRPHCATCRACISVRLRLRDFTPDAGHRRILRKNAYLHTKHVDAVSSAEIYDLFRRYQQSRHADSEMAAMDASDLAQMIEQHTGHARLLTARDDAGQLAAVMLYDDLPDGRSAVYSFFDPDLSAQSPGTWMILHMAADTRAIHKSYLYLGYWIAASPKMAYKAHFQPLEMMQNSRWVDMGKDTAKDRAVSPV